MKKASPSALRRISDHRISIRLWRTGTAPTRAMDIIVITIGRDRYWAVRRRGSAGLSSATSAFAVD